MALTEAVRQVEEWNALCVCVCVLRAWFYVYKNESMLRVQVAHIACGN